MQATLQRLFLTGFMLLSLWLALFTLYLCYALEWRGPMRDLWEFIGIIESLFQGHWDWQGLLEPYGGIHRIFLPKLLFYLDYRLASGSNLLSLSITLLLHISACALLLRSVVVNHRFDNYDKGLSASIILLFFFSTTQIYNLIYNSDNQVVISNSFAVIAAWCFTRQKILFAYVLLIAACLSHSSSLMLLPAFILLSVLLRYPKKIILLQVIFAILLLGLYVSGADPLDNPANTLPLWQQLPAALFSTLMQIDGIVRYIGLHLSSPTSRLWPSLGITIAYTSIAYLFYYLWRVFRKQKNLDETERFFLCLALYVFFIAVITACGRQIYPNSALTDRFQTLVMTYWPALLILLYRDLQACKPGIAWFSPLATLLLLLPHQYNSAREMAWLSSRVSVAHTAATVGITDMENIAATLSHPLLMDNKNLVAVHNDFLRDYGLGYFSDEGSEYFLARDVPILLDKPILQNKYCGGELLEQKAVDLSSEGITSLRLEGRGYIHSNAVATVLIVDAIGEVIGLGRDQRAKGEFRPHSLRNLADTRWVGFVRSATPLHYPLSVVTSDGNSYCELFTVLQEDDQGG